MTKKIIALFLVAALLVAALPASVLAEKAEPENTRASSYLSAYSTYLKAGTAGKLRLPFVVQATGMMTQVGIFSIVVRNSDGSIYQTIWGSTANGLLKANGFYHTGVYTLNLISGNSYYCTVKFIAKDASGSDTRSMITSVVTCP